MVRATGSRNNDLVVDYAFDIFAEDQLGLTRIDVDGNSNNDLGIFPGAIQNFEVVIQDRSLQFLLDGRSGDEEFFNTILIGRDFPDDLDVDDSFDGLLRDIPNPITLDLVAQRTENQFSSSGDFLPSIEYNLLGAGLDVLGVSELSLIIYDADGNDNNGFQIVLNRDTNFENYDFNSEEGFQFTTESGEIITINLLEDEEFLEEQGLIVYEIDPVAAINDIEYITNGNQDLPVSPLDFVIDIGVSGPSLEDPSIIIESQLLAFRSATFETVFLEAEDLNLEDSAYQVESFDFGDVIGLRESTLAQGEDITGEVSITVGLDPHQVDISGNYNLTLSTFDENDGAGTIEVLVNGEPRGDLVTLDENPNADTPGNDFPNCSDPK